MCVHGVTRVKRKWDVIPLNKVISYNALDVVRCFLAPLDAEFETWI